MPDRAGPYVRGAAYTHFPGTVSGRFRVNSPETIRECANAGLGIALGPEWLYEEGLKNGNLQILLRDYVAPLVPIQAVYVADRLLPKRAIVFMDFIAEIFAKTSAFHTS